MAISMKLLNSIQVGRKVHCLRMIQNTTRNGLCEIIQTSSYMARIKCLIIMILVLDGDIFKSRPLKMTTQWLLSTKMRCKINMKRTSYILCKDMKVLRNGILQIERSMIPNCQASFHFCDSILILKRMSFCRFQKNIPCCMKPSNGRLKDGLCSWPCQN